MEQHSIKFRKDNTCDRDKVKKLLYPYRKYKVAVVQLNSGEDKEKNLERAQHLINQATIEGAKIIALPESFIYRGKDITSPQVAENISGRAITSLSTLAKELEIYILAGSIYESIPNEKKVYNTSILIDNQGAVKAIYRKIHLFDVTLPNGLEVKESTHLLTGKDITTVQTDIACLGLSICFDLRFPELYRELTLLGSELIFVPSNFTLNTGKDHWEILLRARAIENQVYIIAPNQCGLDVGKGYKSYGHSMIVDPWGKILAEKEADEGVITSEIDLDHLREVRKRLPCLGLVK
ncbi:MAG: carbon-nitrogen hydrolase family protein [bacterium]